MTWMLKICDNRLVLMKVKVHKINPWKKRERERSALFWYTNGIIIRLSTEWYISDLKNAKISKMFQ